MVFLDPLLIIVFFGCSAIVSAIFLKLVFVNEGEKKGRIVTTKSSFRNILLILLWNSVDNDFLIFFFFFSFFVIFGKEEDDEVVKKKREWDEIRNLIIFCAFLSERKYGLV